MNPKTVAIVSSDVRARPPFRIPNPWFLLPYPLRSYCSKRSRLARAVGLKTDWYDADTLMIEAMMRCLELYVVHEHGGLEKLESFSRELRAEDGQDRQASCDEEAAAIWRWWTVERPAHERAHSAWLTEFFGDDSPLRGKETDVEDSARYKAGRAAEKAAEEREEDMLRRLLAIRGALWT